jgi:hypothetical protein
VPTNLALLSPSRKRLAEGDIFVMRLLDLGYVFGRVVNTKAVWAVGDGVGPANLLYVYAGLQAEMNPPDHLRPEALLVPPLMTNRLGWSRGYFQTVGHEPLGPDDVLPVHCFRRSNGEYFDERGRRLPGPVEPVGLFGLHSYRTIDDDVSRALGVPLAED